MIVEEDRKGCVQCQVTSSTHDKKSRTLITIKKGKYYLKHNSLQDVSINKVINLKMVVFEVVRLYIKKKKYSTYEILNIIHTKNILVM